MEAFVKEILCRFDFFRLFRLDLPIYNSLFFFSPPIRGLFSSIFKRKLSSRKLSASLLFNFFFYLVVVDGAFDVD